MRFIQRKLKRGSAIILALFFLVLLALLGFAFMQLLPVELNAAMREKELIQGGYAADAAIVTFAQTLEETGTPLAVGATGTLNNDWSWEVLAVDTSLGSNTYRVTVEGQLRGMPRRRVMAILDHQDDFNPINYALFVDSAGLVNNQNSFFPGNIPIFGDVFFDGVWSYDTTAIDVTGGDPADAPIQGVVYYTETATSGNGAIDLGAHGERYTGGDSPVHANATTQDERYSRLYRDGEDGLFPNFPRPESNTSETNLQNTTIHHEVVSDVLGLASGASDSAIDTAEANHMDAVENDSNVGNVYLVNDGSQATGGIYVAGDVFDMEWGQDNSGNSTLTMEVQRNLFGGNPNHSDTWVVTYTGTQISVAKEGSQTQSFPVAGSVGNGVIFVNGDIEGLHTDRGPDGNYGTGDERGHRGQHTVAADGNVTITGEILKDQNTSHPSAFPRPAAADAPGTAPPEDPNADILGIISGATLNPSGNYGVMSIEISETTPDNNYYIYAPLMGLNKKMFSNATGSTAPNGGEIICMGQIVMGASNMGQLNTATNFYEDFVRGIWLDPNNGLLPYWPTIGGTGGQVIMRAYLEGSWGEIDY